MTEHDQARITGIGTVAGPVGDQLQWPGVPAMFTLRDRDGDILVVAE